MATKMQIKTLRAHKLAALIVDARLYARRTPEETCSLLGWDEFHLQALESAMVAPSLPEVEALAAIYAVPVDHFFGSKSLSDEMPSLRVDTMNQRLELRQRIIGAQIIQARTRQSLAREDLSLVTDIPMDHLTAYELGESPIPIPDLEEITRALRINLDEWIDSYAIPTRAKSFDPVKEDEVEVPIDLNETRVSKELAEFIVNPVNKQYLIIANKLSSLPADQLRRIAESLLEITY